MESQVRGFSHSQRYQIALQFCGNYAGLRFERNFFLGCSDLVCETREATRAVATHLRFSAIGVEVTHPKICAVSPSFEQQDPVGADAAMPITQLRDLAAIQPNVSHPREITTTSFLSRSSRCQQAVITLSRISQRFGCNRRHILSPGNSSSSLPGRVSVRARPIWYLSEPLRLYASAVSFVSTTAPLSG